MRIGIERSLLYHGDKRNANECERTPSRHAFIWGEQSPSSEDAAGFWQRSNPAIQ